MHNGQLCAAVLLLGISTLMWGCQTPPPAEPEPPPEIATEPVLPEADPHLAPADVLRNAIALLQEGDAVSARRQLADYLGNVPDSRMARNLMTQIDTPIAEYFPDRYFTVTLARGESLSSLARTYLDDALKFHALARYNGIDKPAQVIAGQTIRIPETATSIAALARAQTSKVGPKQADAATDDAQTPDRPAAPPAPHTASGERVETEAPEDRQTGDDTADLLTRAEVAADTGDYASAMVLAGEARQHAPDDPAVAARAQAIERRTVEFHYQQAVSAFSRQDLAGTISHADAVLAIDPEHTNARLYRTRALELQRKLEALGADADG